MNQYLELQRLEKRLLAEQQRCAKANALVEYLSMMTDIPIPEEEEEHEPLTEV